MLFISRCGTPLQVRACSKHRTQLELFGRLRVPNVATMEEVARVSRAAKPNSSRTPRRRPRALPRPDEPSSTAARLCLKWNKEMPLTTLTREEVVAALGSVDDHLVAEILATGASSEEFAAARA